LGIKGGGHEASHEVDRLLAVQSLLADQRAPGPERERVADRRGLDAAPEQLAELCARHELDMDPESIPGLLERFDLRIGEPL
jgi:hypothetical protein